MPTATDLVTDLPADFEVFGQAVATSLADLLGGTSGQVLTKNSNTDLDFIFTTPASTSFTTGTTDVATSQSTTSTTYVDLATVQAVTITTGTKALVIIKTDVQNGASFNVGGLMSYAVSGATTVAASDTTNTGLRFFAGNGNLQLASGAAFLQTGLTAGSNVFTAKFKCDGGNSVTFLNRRIQVINLGS